jgi:hypothetical protein
MAKSRADSLPPPFLFRFESPAALGHFLRDLLAPAAEERADRNPESSLIGESGFKRGCPSPRFIARHLHACRGAEEIGKCCLGQMGMPAITAEVVIEGPSVNVRHGNTKDRRRERGVVEARETLTLYVNIANASSWRARFMIHSPPSRKKPQEAEAILGMG